MSRVSVESGPDGARRPPPGGTRYCAAWRPAHARWRRSMLGSSGARRRSTSYAQYGGLDWVHALFLGIGPAVLAIIAIAAFKLARSTNKRDPVLWMIAVILCAATAISGAEIVWLFLAAGAFGAIYYGGGLPRFSGAASFSPLGVVAAVKGLAWAGSGASLGTLA